jgi:hypothetical protein
MGVTRRDVSGVFNAELKAKHSARTAAFDHVSNLSPKGITFVTQTYLPEWTEVGVEMKLPPTGARRDRHVDCRGVVVQCARQPTGKGFEVSLLFLDLPKGAAARLAVSPRTAPTPSISIAR